MVSDAIQDLDWDILHALRAGYLGGTPGHALADYWISERVLAHYDATFAKRIAWKWQGVLAEFEERGLSWPEAATLYDWGTGSGAAVRTVVAQTPGATWRGARLFDRSPLAVTFAANALRTEGHGLPVSAWQPRAGFDARPAVLLVSHVTTELDGTALSDLTSLAGTADLCIWVEPGTAAAASTLVGAREEMRKTHRILAPCAHQNKCGMLSRANATNWCHFFARPPSEASRSAFWAEFSHRLGVDLRSLPLSFLVAAKRHEAASNAEVDADERARVIGRSREYKGYLKLLACTKAGVTNATLQKRRDKTLFKAMAEVGRRDMTGMVPSALLELEAVTDTE